MNVAGKAFESAAHGCSAPVPVMIALRRARVERHDATDRSSMTDFPASHRDLLEGSYGALSTIAPSGHPQVTAVVFLLDEDGEVRISLNETRKKVRNLRANPACTFFLLDLNNPLRYLEIRADAELAADPGKAFAAKVGAKYGGADFTEHDGPGEGRVIVTLRPVAVNAVDLSAPPE
jgi:PPOX class probable F420-dependent enzyme